MPRLSNRIPNTVIQPRGAVLRVGLDQVEPAPYFVHIQEVPRSGAVVTRSFQRCRWHDGKIYTWIGRRNQLDRGEASSGLAFDQIVPKSTSA